MDADQYYNKALKVRLKFVAISMGAFRSSMILVAQRRRRRAPSRRRTADLSAMYLSDQTTTAILWPAFRGISISSCDEGDLLIGFSYCALFAEYIFVLTARVFERATTWH